MNEARKEFLEKSYNMACYNLFCCSKNYLMTIPREGQEEQWNAFREEAEMLEDWIDEIN